MKRGYLPVDPRMVSGEHSKCDQRCAIDCCSLDIPHFHIKQICFNDPPTTHAFSLLKGYHFLICTGTNIKATTKIYTFSGICLKYYLEVHHGNGVHTIPRTHMRSFAIDLCNFKIINRAGNQILGTIAKIC